MVGGKTAQPATEHISRVRGQAARRLAIWICLLGLPLAYEFSAVLPGPMRFYEGEKAYWYAGLDVRLVLLAVGLAAVAAAMRLSGQGLADVGWPPRLRAWHIIVGVALLGLGVVLALQHPASVSPAVQPVSGSTPITVGERLAFLGLTVAEAIGQEMIWRGVLIRWLEPSVGPVGAALLAGFSYMFYHPGFGIDFRTLRVLLPLTAVYTALVLWRKNLVPSTILHFVVTVGQLTIPI